MWRRTRRVSAQRTGRRASGSSSSLLLPKRRAHYTPATGLDPARMRPVDNEVGPFLADTIFAALHLIRLEGEGVRFAADSLMEGDGFELSVPRQRISVYRVIRSVACEG